ncbi:hypothetical protein [Hydrogenophaga sp.]|uniref:hypothetical protein n=1 Tax=Hydrogenophaga sp. TaxID=1904254 RepID=UPI003F70A29E
MNEVLDKLGRSMIFPLIAVSPTSAIPGVTAVVAVIVFLLVGQIHGVRTALGLHRLDHHCALCRWAVDAGWRRGFGLAAPAVRVAAAVLASGVPRLKTADDFTSHPFSSLDFSS